MHLIGNQACNATFAFVLFWRAWNSISFLRAWKILIWEEYMVICALKDKYEEREMARAGFLIIQEIASLDTYVL